MKGITSLKKLWVLIGFILFLFNCSTAQDKPQRTAFNQTSLSNFKFMASAQFWGRYTDLNPGSTVQGTPQTYTTDISIRRFRLMTTGNINNRWFIKFQLGANNLNYLNRDPILRILDIEAFYKFNDKLEIGGGKSGYVGLSRYAAPATASALAFDVPIFNLATVNMSDDMIRKMSLIAKGQIGKLDYRVILSRPMIPENTKTLSEFAEYERRTPELQKSAYVKYQFLEKEAANSAFTPATYFGAKRLINLGAGFLHQAHAMWNKSSTGDTLRHSLVLFAVDFFLELPLDISNSRSLTFYTGYFDYNFGPGYIRNIGANNAADGVRNGSFNGAGNSFPAAGTGTILYSQFAYRFGIKNFIQGIQSFQPYFTIQHAQYDRLNSNMIVMDYGINILMNGHDSKLTIGVQDRPVFDYDSENQLTLLQRKFMGVVQYQVKIR